MDVIDELITHCEAWEPWARVMGNVCAGDAAQALRSLRAELAEWRSALAKVGPYYIPATNVSDEEAEEVYAAIDAARKGEGE